MFSAETLGNTTDIFNEIQKWFPRSRAAKQKDEDDAPEPAPAPRLRLLCFHGIESDPTIFLSKGSAGRFLRNPLVQYCEENNVQLLTAHPPSRTSQLSDRHLHSVQEIVENVLNVLMKIPDGACFGSMTEVPLVVTGHSVGAICAYEFACLMRKKNLELPKHLILSCMVSPDTVKTCRLWKLDGDLQRPMELDYRYAGLHERAVWRDMWNIHEPILRSNFQVMDGYNLKQDQQSDVSLTKHMENEIFDDTPQVTTENSPVSVLEAGDLHHRPLRVPTTLFFASGDRIITQPHSIAEGWRRVIIGTSNVSTQSSQGFFQKTDADDFKIIEIQGEHNFFYEPEGRDKWMRETTEILDKVLLDLDYGL